MSASDLTYPFLGDYGGYFVLVTEPSQVANKAGQCDWWGGRGLSFQELLDTAQEMAKEWLRVEKGLVRTEDLPVLTFDEIKEAVESPSDAMTHSLLVKSLLEGVAMETVQPVVRPDLSQVLGPSIAGLLKDNPSFPGLRGDILRRTGYLYIPDDIPPEGMLDFVHANIKPFTPKPVVAKRLRCEITWSESEYGQASYSIGRSMRAEVSFTEEEIREALEEHGGDVEDAYKSLVESAEEEARNRGEDSGDDGYSYDNHESSESSTDDWDFGDLERIVREYAEQNQVDVDVE